MTLQIAALASGTGSNVVALQEHIEAGRLDARLCLLLCNKPEAPVVATADRLGIPSLARSHKDYSHRETFARD